MANNDVQSRMLSNEGLKQQLENNVETVMRDAERQQRRQQFDQQVQLLGERALAFKEQYGIDSEFTQIMMTFLQLTLEVKSTIDLLNDIGIALQCIGQAMSCIDDVLNVFQEVLDFSMGTRYGFWERMRRRRKLRRAMRNNTARMKQTVDMLVGSQNLAMSMIGSLRTAMDKMRTVTQRNFAREKRRRDKQGNTAPGEELGLAMKFMNDLEAQQNGGDASGTTDGNGGGTGNAGGSTPSPSTGSGNNGSSGGNGSDSGETRDISGIV